MDIMHDRLLELIGDKHGAGSELAAYLGLKPNNITNWKAGRTTAYKAYVREICLFYGVSADWLCGFTDKRNPPTVSDEGIVDRQTVAIMELVGRLTPDQKLLILAQLKGITGK